MSEPRELTSFINPASVLAVAALLLGIGLPAAGLVSPGAGLLMVIASVVLVGIAVRLVVRETEPQPAAPSSPPLDSLKRAVRKELVAAIGDGDALTANIFQSAGWGTYKHWRDTTAVFLEVVFGEHERSVFEDPPDPPDAGYTEHLKQQLQRLRELRDRPEGWEVHVDEAGLRLAAHERRFRTIQEQIVEAQYGSPQAHADDGFKADLQEQHDAGNALLVGIPNRWTVALGLAYRIPETREEDVDEWEARVIGLLRRRDPELIKRFTYTKERTYTMFEIGMRQAQGSRAELRDRLVARLGQLKILIEELG